MGMFHMQKNVDERQKRIQKLRKGRTHKYGQVKRKHAVRGINSCYLAGFSALFLLLLFIISYVRRGNVGFLVGILGIYIFFQSVMGVKKGLEGLKERNKDYTYCKVGIGCNAFMILAMIAVFIRGLL